MKLNKLTASLLAASALAFGSSAHAVTVAGVTWDENFANDFFADSQLWESIATIQGQSFEGYGRFISLNDSLTFCSGCELTFYFDEYVIQNNLTALGDPFTATGGRLRVYVDDTPDFNSSNANTAQDGLLFLELLGADPLGVGYTLSGSITEFAAAGLSGQGSGYLDVADGLAKTYFDTNGQPFPGGADFLFTSSFQPLSVPYTANGITYTHRGTAEITGTTAVPEPATLALLGLGLVGLGLARRSKKVA